MNPILLCHLRKFMKTPNYDQIWDIKEEEFCIFTHFELLTKLFGARNRTAVITAPYIYLIVIRNVTINQHGNITNTIQENVKKVTKR